MIYLKVLKSSGAAAVNLFIQQKGINFMKVKDVMTKNPIFVRKNDALKKLLRILSEKRITGCPVVDSEKRIIGMVTETDILKLIDVHARIHSPKDRMFSLVLAMIKSEKYDSVRSGLKKVFMINVRDFMTRSVVAVDANEDVYTAARLMNKHGISKLPVTRNRRLAGIISKWDIIRMLERMED